MQRVTTVIVVIPTSSYIVPHFRVVKSFDKDLSNHFTVKFPAVCKYRKCVKKNH